MAESAFAINVPEAEPYVRVLREKYDASADFKHLQALYSNRDHLILTPVGSPWPFEEFGEDALLRTSANNVADVSLSSAAPVLTLRRSPVPLDEVRLLG